MALIKKSAKLVQEALKEYDFSLEVIEFNESTKTSIDAANAIGCELGQIAKSLIFRGRESQEAILIIASGVNRVNLKEVIKYTKEKLDKADAAFVLQETGYAIGGIPPIGHIKPIKTMIDKDLFLYEEIWAAAGTPNAVFKLTPEILKIITNGDLINVL